MTAQFEHELNETLRQIQESVITLDSGLRMSQHPLYHTLWTHEDMEIPEHIGHGTMGKEWLRRYVEQKLITLNRAKLDRDWDTYVFTHERPYRVSVLYELVRNNLIKPRLYPKLNKLVLDVWTDTEFPHQSYNEWQRIFEYCLLTGLNNALDDEERKARNNLPNTLKIYRGVRSDEPKPGFSWTTSRKTAEWFAKRFSSKGKVVTRVASKNELVGPLMGRGENEMIAIYPNLLRKPKKGDS